MLATVLLKTDPRKRSDVYQTLLQMRETYQPDFLPQYLREDDPILKEGFDTQIWIDFEEPPEVFHKILEIPGVERGRLKVTYDPEHKASHHKRTSSSQQLSSAAQSS